MHKTPETPKQPEPHSPMLRFTVHCRPAAAYAPLLCSRSARVRPTHTDSPRVQCHKR
jgi:hypothetical protein